MSVAHRASITSQSEASSIPPALPHELERHIFEISAHSRPLSIPTLILVAWRVKIWVEPLLYRTIVWSRTGLDCNRLPIARGNTILKAIKSKPSAFIQDNVHHLMLDGGGNARIALLTACRAVKNLWVGAGDTLHDLFPLAEDLLLMRISCHLGWLFGGFAPIDFTHRLFARITHLELVDYAYPVDPRIWGNLTLVPHLTHLSFWEPVFVSFFPTFLRTCHSLRVLVVLDLRYTESLIRTLYVTKGKNL
ncbi:hypothetical protein B0H19DRAFT_1124268 [Mycena capillaripes]|nr:hypothetical protein B0H19DRAFT_1124268 [Mycena capillaripes]